jgi:predicted dehydrogenase
MLDTVDVDAVSICTDHASHEKLVLEALAAGKHVLCEKPLTTSLASLERLLRAARESRCVTAGILQHRFDPIYVEVRKLIAEGGIGSLQSASCQHACLRPPAYYAGNWRGTWGGEGGSLLINQSIHFFDILQWLAGGIAEAKGLLVNREHQGIIETEDGASISLRFKDGGLGTFLASSACYLEWSSRFQFVGTQGALYLENGKLVEAFHADPARRDAILEQFKNLAEGVGVPGAKDYYGSSHPAQVADFVSAIREGREPVVGFAEAAETLEAILRLYASEGPGLRA